MVTRSSISVEARERLARIEVSVDQLREDREQAHVDRRELIAEIKELRGDVANIQQTLLSTQNVVNTLALEKCGERLAQHDLVLTKQDDRISLIDERTADYPEIKADFLFWRRVWGTGWGIALRVGLALMGTAAVGGAGSRFIDWLSTWHH